MFRFTIILCLALLIGYNGSAQKYLKKIQERGELRVGMTVKQPPFSMKDKNGKTIGYEVELAELLAKGMEVKLKIVEMQFSELLNSLEEGKIDMVMSGMTITTQRNMKSIFVGPYLLSGKSILTHSPSYTDTDEAKDLNRNNISIVVLRGSTSEQYVKKEIPDAKLLLGNDYDDCIQLLVDKNAQIMVADYPICAYTTLLFPEKGLITIDKPLTIEPIGVALPVDAAHFINLVENFLNRLALKGVLDEMEYYWFESGEWARQMPKKSSIFIY